MWWLVTTRPSGETKEPEPPLLKRTDAFWTCSNQPLGGAKPYLSLSNLRGGRLGNHIPSSARPVRALSVRNSPATQAVRSRLRFIGVTLRETAVGGWVNTVIGPVMRRHWRAEVKIQSRWRLSMLSLLK